MLQGDGADSGMHSDNDPWLLVTEDLTKRDKAGLVVPVEVLRHC